VFPGEQAVNGIMCAAGCSPACQHRWQLSAELGASSMGSCCVHASQWGWLLSAYVPLAQPAGGTVTTFSYSWGRGRYLIPAFTQHPLGRTSSSPSPVLQTGPL